MWGKILAGAAIGVGAVAAAPFTGGGSLLGGASLVASLTGAGAVASATGVGLAGAAAGGAMARSEKSKADNIKKEGIAQGKAEMAAQLSKLEEKLNSALSKLKSHDEHFRAIIALEAVGVSCAACDGDFSANERAEIGEFVRGMVEQKIPLGVKEKIKEIYDNPPTVKEAFYLAKNSGIELEVYEDIIKFVMQIDGVNKAEEEFVHAWYQLKAA